MVFLFSVLVGKLFLSNVFLVVYIFFNRNDIVMFGASVTFFIKSLLIITSSLTLKKSRIERKLKKNHNLIIIFNV